MQERISWDDYAMHLAKAASLRSEDPYIKVGACALSHTNRVLGVSYNGLREKFVADKDFWSDRDKRRPFVLHAETNLLSLVRPGDCRLIAVTLLPCESCARQIIAWNISYVLYLKEYDQQCALNTIDIFNFYNVNVKKIVV